VRGRVGACYIGIGIGTGGEWDMRMRGIKRVEKRTSAYLSSCLLLGIVNGARAALTATPRRVIILLFFSCFFVYVFIYIFFLQVQVIGVREFLLKENI
jgi:hypothetical protein